MNLLNELLYSHCCWGGGGWGVNPAPNCGIVFFFGSLFVRNQGLCPAQMQAAQLPCHRIAGVGHSRVKLLCLESGVVSANITNLTIAD